MTGPKIGSLCSGYGGLDAAAEQLTSGTVAWVSDIDKGACKILAHRYPDVPNLGDFTTTDWSTVEPIYMLTAGYPCQPFSHAGKREGTNDARHLWPFVLRCLTALRPPFALFENVRGHLSLGFDQVLADLATHDYDARWIVMRAADIGAPHGRARLFILAADSRRGGDRWDLVGAGRGSVRVGGVRGEDPDVGGDAGRDGVRGGMTLLPTPTTSDTNGAGSHGDGGTDLRTTVSLLPTPTARDGKDGQIRREPHRPNDVDTLARALTVTLPGQSGEALVGDDIARGVFAAVDIDESAEVQDGFGAESDVHEATLAPKIQADLAPGSKDFALLPTPAVNDMGASYTPETWDEWTAKMQAAHGNGNGHGKSLSIEAQRLPTDWEHGDVYDTAVMDDGELSLTMRPATQWGDYAAAIARWEHVLDRPAPAPTQTNTKGNPQLSPRFVEWMMGLPEGWVTDVPDMTRNECLKALGNGVVTQQAVEAVRRLLTLAGAA